jgi:hypothetical protein
MTKVYTFDPHSLSNGIEAFNLIKETAETVTYDDQFGRSLGLKGMYLSTNHAAIVASYWRVATRRLEAIEKEGAEIRARLEEMKS